MTKNLTFRSVFANEIQGLISEKQAVGYKCRFRSGKAIEYILTNRSPL
jgi:hypothetical protein